MELIPNLLSYVDSHAEESQDLLITLAQIPAPSHHEEKRAVFCAEWLRQQGAKGVYIDDARNVVYPIGCTETNPVAVFMAHSDVVFPDTTPLPLSVSDGKIHCPGVGDDTANVVALMMAAKFIAQNNLTPKENGILLVINSCEEGLGNLKGCRKIMQDFSGRVTEFITFDGTVKQIVNRAVGSRRYEVTVETEGGHSYSKFGNRNAIAYLASIIHDLYQIQVPSLGKTTYNVGTIQGGTSVNTIAQNASMLFEFRSDEAEALEIMENHFRNVIANYTDRGLQVSVTLLGDRPCSGKLDWTLEETLMHRAARAVSDHYGYEVSFRSGSTDCNIPLSIGVPAVCVGCAEGDGAHTREEYVQISSLRPGLGVALQLILHHF